MLSWTISHLLIGLYCERATITEKGKIDGWMEIRRVSGCEHCVLGFVTGRLLQWIARHRPASAARHHRLWVLCEPLAFFFPPHFLGKRHDCSLPGFGLFLLHLLSPACVWLSWVHLVQVCAVFEKTINPSENSRSFLTRASVLQPLPCEMKVRKNWRKSNRRPNHVQHQSSADALFAWWPAFLGPSQEALREYLDSFVSLFCSSLL